VCGGGSGSLTSEERNTPPESCARLHPDRFTVFPCIFSPQSIHEDCFLGLAAMDMEEKLFDSFFAFYVLCMNMGAGSLAWLCFFFSRRCADVDVFYYVEKARVHVLSVMGSFWFF
jgi:hypothetical protein